jgi:hypothetical protein
MNMDSDTQDTQDGRVLSAPGSREPSPTVSALTGFDPSRGAFEFADRIILDGFNTRHAQQLETLEVVLKENERLRQALVTIRVNAMRSTPKTRAALISFCDMGLREVLAGSSLSEAYKVWDAYQKCSACGAASAMPGNGLCFECTPEGQWPASGMQLREDERSETEAEGLQPGPQGDAQPLAQPQPKDSTNG